MKAIDFSRKWNVTLEIAYSYKFRFPSYVHNNKFNFREFDVDMQRRRELKEELQDRLLYCKPKHIVECFDGVNAQQIAFHWLRSLYSQSNSTTNLVSERAYKTLSRVKEYIDSNDIPLNDVGLTMKAKEFLDKYNFIGTSTIKYYKTKYRHLVKDGRLDYHAVSIILDDRMNLFNEIKEIFKDKTPMELSYLFDGDNNIAGIFRKRMLRHRKSTTINDRLYYRLVDIYNKLKEEQ